MSQAQPFRSVYCFCNLLFYNVSVVCKPSIIKRLDHGLTRHFSVAQYHEIKPGPQN